MSQKPKYCKNFERNSHWSEKTIYDNGVRALLLRFSKTNFFFFFFFSLCFFFSFSSLFIFSLISQLIWVRLGWNFHRWFSKQKQVNWCTIDSFSLLFCTSQHSYPVPLKFVEQASAIIRSLYLAHVCFMFSPPPPPHGGHHDATNLALQSVFPQLKNRFPGMTSEISWNFSNFLKLKKAKVRLLDAREKFIICTTLMPFFEINVHGLGVGPLTKWIEIGLCMRASKKKKMLFQTIKVIFFYMFTSYFPYSWISRNFLEFFHFPKITRKRSGFPGIREISFKVETLIAVNGVENSSYSQF